MARDNYGRRPSQTEALLRTIRAQLRELRAGLIVVEETVVKATDAVQGELFETSLVRRATDRRDTQDAKDGTTVDPGKTPR